MIELRSWARGIFVSSLAAAFLFAAVPETEAQSCNCANPTTRVCKQFCKRLTCLPGTSAPSFIQTKDCAPTKNIPAHQVQRICCTGGSFVKPKVKCRNYPPCRKLSNS